MVGTIDHGTYPTESILSCCDLKILESSEFCTNWTTALDFCGKLPSASWFPCTRSSQCTLLSTEFSQPNSALCLWLEIFGAKCIPLARCVTKTVWPVSIRDSDPNIQVRNVKHQSCVTACTDLSFYFQYWKSYQLLTSKRFKPPNFFWLQNENDIL